MWDLADIKFSFPGATPWRGIVYPLSHSTQADSGDGPAVGTGIGPLRLQRVGIRRNGIPKNTRYGDA